MNAPLLISPIRRQFCNALKSVCSGVICRNYCILLQYKKKFWNFSPRVSEGVISGKSLHIYLYHLNQNCNLTLEFQDTFNSWLFNDSFQSSERTFKVILASQHSIKEKFLELETKTFQKDWTKIDQWRYYCENSCFQCTCLINVSFLSN